MCLLMQSPLLEQSVNGIVERELKKKTRPRALRSFHYRLLPANFVLLPSVFYRIEICLKKRERERERKQGVLDLHLLFFAHWTQTVTLFSQPLSLSWCVSFSSDEWGEKLEVFFGFLSLFFLSRILGFFFFFSAKQCL